jgi:hypothetical protein
VSTVADPHDDPVTTDSQPATTTNQPAPLPTRSTLRRQRLMRVRSGDGTVHYAGPTLLLPDSGVQQLPVDITNVSKARATYTVRLDTPGIPLSATKTATIPAGSTHRVQIPVDTAGLRPGTYPLTVTLSSNTAGADLSTDTNTITVPNLSDPNQLQQARDALTKLRSLPADSGLDPHGA